MDSAIGAEREKRRMEKCAEAARLISGNIGIKTERILHVQKDRVTECATYAESL